jgi:hypothetical protein
MEPFPNQEGSVSRLTTLTTVMHAGLPKTFSSSGYKSQKKNQTQGRGGDTGEGRRQRRKKTEKEKHWRGNETEEKENREGET